MNQPTPRPVAPDEVVSLAQAVIRADRFPILATLDGDQPRARPVSPLRTDGFTVYVASLRRYHKTGEIEAQPKVELCYVGPDHDQVRLAGTAAVVGDRSLIDDLWRDNPLLAHYLGSPDHPELVVYRITPSHVRFMREWALEYHDIPLARAGRPDGAA